MKININQLPNPRLIKYLYDSYYLKKKATRDMLSSFWKEFVPKLNLRIDKHGDIVSFKGYGFGSTYYTNILNLLLQHICNISYFIRLENKKELIFLIKEAMSNLKKINGFLSYDSFRQICAVCEIKKNLTLSEKDEFNILVIGDGNGFLSCLLKRIYPKSKIILLDIGEVLSFQAINAQIIYPESSHVYFNDANLSKKTFDFLYIPAEEMDKYSDVNIKYTLSVNIVSMQEMSYETINRYFDLLRTRSNSYNLFYCCNRVLKVLPGGERIEFSKFPWHAKDRHILDGEPKFYRYFLSGKFPFMHFFDGPIHRRLSHLYTGKR